MHDSNSISVSNKHLTINRVILFGTAVIVFLLSLFCEWNKDSLRYTFIVPPDGSIGNIPIQNINDIWHSQLNHYMAWNGRFIVHFIIQFFCGIAGKTTFSICNAIMWILLIQNMSKFSDSRNNQHPEIISSTILCIFLFSSLPFDPAYDINYVWVSYVIVLWMRLFFHNKKSNLTTLIGVGLLSIIAGQLHEGFSIPICATLIFWLIKNHGKHSKRQYIMGICFAIGSIILIVAPGNFIRLQEGSNENISMLQIIEKIPACFIFPGIYLILRMFTKPTIKRQDGHITPLPIPNLFIKSFIIVALIFCIFLLNFERALITYNLGFALLCINYISGHEFYTDVIYIGSILAFFTLLWATLTEYKVNLKTNEIIKKYELSQSGRIYLDDNLYLYRRNETRSWWLHAYTNLLRARQDPNKPFLSVYPESAKNINLEKDTNLIMQIGPQSWICVQSATQPARFTVTKTLEAGGILHKKLSPRDLDFSSSSDILIDSTANFKMVLYHNRHPQLKTEVHIE